MATTLLTERKTLSQPTLHDLAETLSSGMAKNFQFVSVSVVDCPDLTKTPFGLAAQGIGGRPTILDVGGVPYLIPTPVIDRTYNFDILGKIVGINDAYFIGAGAGGCHILGVNSEMMANVKLSSDGN